MFHEFSATATQNNFDVVRKRCQDKSCFENYLAKQQKEFVISPTDAIVHPWAMMIHPLEVDFGWQTMTGDHYIIATQTMHYC